jgi:hypothetical protein
LVLVIVGRQIFSFWYLVCHHKKSGEFGLFVGTLLSLGEWLSLFMCVLVILYAHWRLLCSLGGLWSQSCVELIL